MKQMMVRLAARLTSFLNRLGEDFDMGFVDDRLAFYGDLSSKQIEDGLFV